MTSRRAASGECGLLACAYNDIGWLTETTASIAGTADFQNTYAHDAAGRMTHITQTGRGGNSVEDKRVDLAYNETAAGGS